MGWWVRTRAVIWATSVRGRGQTATAGGDVQPNGVRGHFWCDRPIKKVTQRCCQFGFVTIKNYVKANACAAVVQPLTPGVFLLVFPLISPT